MRRTVAELLLLAGLLAIASCSGIPQQTRSAEPLGLTVSDFIAPASPKDLDASGGYRYRLNVGDKLDVKYFNRLEYSTQVTIAPDGTISLPFLPFIQAEGKTVEELTLALESQYRQLSNDSPKPADKKYLISVGDTLEIKFPYINQYSGTAKVRPDGKISLPLIGSVIAEGKQPDELQSQLEQDYRLYLENPVIVISVTDAVSPMVISDGQIKRVALPEMNNLYVSLQSSLELKVYVGGEVKTPGSIRYEPMLTSLQAIVAAGGITEKSALNNVIILRKGGDNQPRYIVRDLAADISGERSEHNKNLVVTNDIELRPFDVIIVPKTGIAKVSDGLNAYLFDLLPMLRNSSIGFNYQLGTTKIEQNTNLIDQTGE